MRRAAIASLALLGVLACQPSEAIPGDAAVRDDAARDAGAAFTLPVVSARCAMPVDRAVHALGVSDPVPVLALARGATDLALAYVVRTPYPALARFELQRLALDGSPAGDPIVMSPVDMSIPGTVSVVLDGSAYLACTVIVGGASCFRVDATGSHDDAMVLDASAIAIAHGSGGVIGAWIAGGQLNVGPLSGATGVVATTDLAPSIAATDSGYVVGYVAGGTAFVVSLDASGVAGAPLALGPALASGRVAVAFTAGRIGASYVGTTGDAMAAVVVDGLARTLAVGPGAMSRGHVSIARASDGFFVTWSSSGDAIEGVFVDLDGVASGARYAHDTAWNDDAHAALGLAEGWLLATDTMPGASPVHVALVGCP